MGTVSTKISNIKLNLSNQNKRVLSENISTKTKELISEYNNYTNEVIGELKDTNFYQNVSETVQTIQEIKPDLLGDDTIDSYKEEEYDK